ncbi:hypothetical protein AAG906_037993 [Vitis piasezkii]
MVQFKSCGMFGQRMRSILLHPTILHGWGTPNLSVLEVWMVLELFFPNFQLLLVSRSPAMQGLPGEAPGRPLRWLTKMANRYGPVMFLKMGTSSMVVASTPEAARAFLKTLDINFSNRPPNAGATHLAYDAQDMVFADYGPRWKLLRKLSNLHMLGGKALEDSSQVRTVELGHMLRAMLELSQREEPVVVPEMLSFSVANMIGQVILSRRVFETKGSESNEFKDMVVELMTTAGYFNIGDFIPSIAWLDIQGIERGMKHLHKKFDKLLTRMIEEHTASAHERKGNPDFLDVVMGHQGNSTGRSSPLPTLRHVENPSILKRAQEEMDHVIGRNRRLVESDLPKLPYLQAICKESFRRHPSTPLNLPRVSTQACEVNGYYIPKNTRLSVNIWAIGRDPDVWESPEEFRPERFLSGRNAKIDPRGNDFELIPFGAGRRICAGTRMGIVLVEYILGTLVHSFDWKMPDGVEINMDEAFGLALQKAVSLSAMVTPRLHQSAYAV